MVILKLFFLLLLTCYLSFSKELLLASTYPLYYPLRHMAEGRFEVDLLIKAPVDPHHYELKPEDMKRLQRAKVFFYLGVEGWEKRVASRVLKERTVALYRGVEFIRVGKHTDPHVWLSPKSYAKLVENMREELLKIDPAGGEHYRKRSEELLKKLKSLDEEYRKTLQSCQSKTLVITHLSTLYLGRDYGLEVVGLRGVHAEEEPRPSEVKRIVEKLKGSKVKAIFSEIGYDERLARRLAKETGAKVLTFNSSLFPEEMQDDYFSVMRRNLKRLSEGLGCQTG
ncbi:MAG: metal ABC transporter substrate-binding protein [Aquificaceae bacterium]|nr:metal ABC transporter substrate-binding protein [Aquificaceae bacterium]